MKYVGISYTTQKQWFPVHSEEKNWIILMRSIAKTYNYFILLKSEFKVHLSTS
jgi:hypothetical protein